MRTLTARERELLLLVANGNTNAAIGRLLGLHHTTVNRHLANIYRALGARDRANAVALALFNGEIDLDDLELPAAHRRTAA